MKKKIRQSESIPEFNKEIENMNQESKDRVDLTLLLLEKDIEIERLKDIIEKVFRLYDDNDEEFVKFKEHFNL